MCDEFDAGKKALSAEVQNSFHYIDSKDTILKKCYFERVVPLLLSLKGAT